MEKNVKDFMIKKFETYSSNMEDSNVVEIWTQRQLENFSCWNPAQQQFNKYIFITIKLNKQLEKRINKHLNTIIDQQ